LRHGAEDRVKLARDAARDAARDTTGGGFNFGDNHLLTADGNSR
jgi:hypothetical protein